VAYDKRALSDERSAVDGLGAGFWLKVIGAVLAFGLGGMILFLLIGMAWYAWGALGALIFCFVLIAAAGWLYDRAHAKQYEDVNP
jgi:hypothetical protein